MLAQEVATKYASALFQSSVERSLLDEGYDQFTQLGKLIGRDRRLMHFLTSPAVPDEPKEAVVRNVFGSRIEQLFVEFLVVLLDKRRIGFLPEIIDAFIKLVEEAKGIARAVVTTAIPLDTEQERLLVARLEKRAGKSILLEKKIDPSILGGMVVMVEGEIIDGSARRGLDRIEEQLEKVKVH